VVEIEDEEADLMKSYFQERRYRLLAYDIGRDRFYTDAGAGRLRHSGGRNFFAVPDEMLSRLPCP
jgi:hypothetical protein